MKPRFPLILTLFELGLAARPAPDAPSHFGISIDPGNTVCPWSLSPILRIRGRSISAAQAPGS